MVLWDGAFPEDVWNSTEAPGVLGLPGWAAGVLCILYFFLALLCVLTALVRCCTAKLASNQGAAEATGPLCILIILFLLFTVRGATFSYDMQDAPLDEHQTVWKNILLHCPVFGVLSIVSILSFDGYKVAHQLTLEVDHAEHQLNLYAERLRRHQSPQRADAALSVSAGPPSQAAASYDAGSPDSSSTIESPPEARRVNKGRWSSLAGTRGLKTMKRVVCGFNLTMWPAFIVSLYVEWEYGSDPEISWPEWVVLVVLIVYVFVVGACCMWTAGIIRWRLVAGRALERRWAKLDKGFSVPGSYAPQHLSTVCMITDSSRLDSSHGQLESIRVESSRSANAAGGRPVVAFWDGPGTANLPGGKSGSSQPGGASYSESDVGAGGPSFPESRPSTVSNENSRGGLLSQNPSSEVALEGSRNNSLGSLHSRLSQNRGRHTPAMGRPSFPGCGEDGATLSPSYHNAGRASATGAPGPSAPGPSAPVPSMGIQAPLLSFLSSSSHHTKPESYTRSMRSLPRQPGGETFATQQSSAGMLGTSTFDATTRRGSFGSTMVFDGGKAAQDAMDSLFLPVRSRFFWLFVAASSVLVYRGIFLVYLLQRNKLSREDGWKDHEMFLYYAVAEVFPMGLLLTLIFKEEVSCFCHMRSLLQGSSAVQLAGAAAAGAILESTQTAQSDWGPDGAPLNN